MKLSELRPCDNCGGKIAPSFYVVLVSQAIINVAAANQTLGLMQIFQGRLGLAEVFTPEPEAVIVLGEKDERLQTEVFLCTECYATGIRDLAMLVEKRNAAAPGEHG